MADRRLAVEITVEGDATRVFKEMGQAAKASAQDMEASSRRAKTGLDQMDKAADSTEQSMRELEAAQKKAAAAAETVGTSTTTAGRSMEQYRSAIEKSAAGMALLGTAFTMYSSQARDHEVAVMALQRTYGDAAQSYLDLANTIQGNTIFSNDQAIEAANIMGTLKRNYELTDAQIQQLIVTSADLAAVNGTTLADAAQRVAAAIRGEAESAEMLGLTMNQAAIDQDNLTLSMSNSEAGAFRFNALMEQSEFAVGAAGDAADTTTGKVQQLTNQFQDAMMSVVGFTGPIGEAAGALGSFGIEAGIAVGGIAQLAKGLMGLKAAGGVAALAASLAGPAGIAIGLGLAAVAGWKLVDSMTGSGALYEASMRTHEQVAALNSEVTALASSFQDAALGLALIDTTTAMGQYVEQAGVDLQAFQDLWNLYGDPATWMANNADIYAQNSQIAEDIDRLRIYMEDFGGSAQEAQAQVDGLLASWSQISSSQNQAAIEDAIEAWDTFNSSLKRESDFDALNASLTEISSNLDEYTRAEIEAEAATQAATNAQRELATATANTRTAVTEQAGSVDILTDAYIAQEVAAAELLKAQTLLRDRQIDRQRANLWSGAEPMAPDVVGITDPRTQRAFSMGQLEINTALIEGAAAAGAAWKATREYVAAVDAGSKVFGQAVEYSDLYAKSLEYGTRSTETSLEAIAELTAEYERLASAIEAPLNAQDALGSTFNTVVGTAQGFARLSESVWDWSNSLTEGNKATSKLGELNRKGLISDKTYRDGLEANHRIMLANNSVQEDSLRIQAKQLPLMAKLAEEQARYVDSIADMPAEQQLVALGFADSAKSAQALELAQLAAASGTDAMQTSTTAMIAEIANADPVMKAMLIDMGLISEGADGTITVNFGDSKDQTDNLIASIDALTIALGGVPPSVSTTVDLIDNASGPLANVLGILNNLDGKTATTYLKTVNQSMFEQITGGATGLHIFPDAQRNIAARVQGMATGGHLRLVGEAGPELVSLPTGSTVTNAAGTRGRLDPMGRRRGGAGAGTVYKGNVIHQTITVEESAFADRTRRVMGKRRTG